MAKTYYDQDANWDILKNKTVAIIGYGSQGHAHALNLKDSGVNVIVGLYQGSKSKAAAESHGLTVLPVAEAVKKADVTMVLIPDEKQADVYKNEIGPNLKSGSALAFAHGFNIHFKQIQPPANVDVFMVAPKGPGHLVRRTFVEGSGVPDIMCVEKGLALKWADGLPILGRPRRLDGHEHLPSESNELVGRELGVDGTDFLGYGGAEIHRNIVLGLLVHVLVDNVGVVGLFLHDAIGDDDDNHRNQAQDRTFDEQVDEPADEQTYVEIATTKVATARIITVLVAHIGEGKTGAKNSHKEKNEG